MFKNLFLFGLASTWISLSAFMLIGLGKHNIPDAPSIKSDNLEFSTDNVLISFNYPSDLKYTLEGDLKDITTYRLITLTNAKKEFYIYIKQNATVVTKSLCRLYNDCMFTNPILLFKLEQDDFIKLDTNRFDAYISRIGGLIDTWEDETYITLDSTTPVSQQLYYIFTPKPNEENIYWLKINLENNLNIEITYMYFTDNITPDLIYKVKNTIETILNTIKW